MSAKLKKDKKTWIQRLRHFILGKEKPNLVTRISVILGFFIWVYLVSWYILTLMVILLMGSLEKSVILEGAFSRIGSKLYGYSDTLNRLTIHTLVELLAYFAILIGLILIYRKKRVGFLIYIIANASCVLATIFIMGLKYFQYETNYTEITLTAITTLYFGLGALWFYRLKPQPKTENTLREN